MLRAFAQWLGPRWTAALIGLAVAALAGGVALQAAYPRAGWRPAAQVALVWLALAGLGVALLMRVSPARRGRVLLAFAPGLALVACGIVAPDLAVFFAGAGIGWMAATQLALRSPTNMTYQTAVRHLHHDEIPEAIAVMDRLIEGQPGDAEHHRFRAELHRLNGALDRARRDYERAVKLAPDAPAGYLGLAELSVQQGKLDQARDYAEQALARDPSGWAAAYNLGLIADRQGDAAEAILYLERALRARIPDARYRLLSDLWLARAYMRRGQLATARQHIAALRKQSGALDAWRIVLASEQAAPLRDLLAADLGLAARLIDGSAPVEALAAPPEAEPSR